MQETGTIALEGIELHAYHGVYRREREQGNRYKIDLYLEYDLRAAAQSDQLADTLDYFEIYKAVLSIMAEPVNLLETLAGRMGGHIMSQYPAVVSVRVRIAKVLPHAMFHCSQTYIEQRFDRP